MGMPVLRAEFGIDNFDSEAIAGRWNDFKRAFFLAVVRLINWSLAHLFFSVRVVSKGQIPETGGALLVCNHVSWVDPMLLQSVVRRPIRFMIYRPTYENRWVNPLARAIRAIPISRDAGPKAIAATLAEARTAIAAGELVCIFAEISITRLGRLLPFGKGLEKIASELDAPIIPLYLDQLWGNPFSEREGRSWLRLPKELPYPVSLMVGAPMPSTSKTHAVRFAIQELSAEAFQYRRRWHRMLHSGFLMQAKVTPFRWCCVDTTGKKLRYYQVLGVTMLLARRFGELTRPREIVGVWLPSSAGSLLANVALILGGRIPVNLNFTAPKSYTLSAVKQCEMRLIVSSRAFLERMPYDGPGEVVLLEDLAREMSFGAKILAMAAALLVPRAWIDRWFTPRGLQSDDIATIIFSSGSTGQPKGVMLSHGNIASNLAGMYELFNLGPEDGLLGVLPFFHSFGFMAGLWLPLLGGLRGVYHPSPLDCEVVGELVEKYKLSLMVGTPTFLSLYTKRCAPHQFRSLRYVVVGAEKLRDRTAYAFQDRFGIMPLEGYGCTELSPVAMVNVPNIEDQRAAQVGHKLGTAGHPLPGIAVKIVDPETFEPRPLGEPGMLLVKGPNVMLGYLNHPELTAEVVRDGWYVTGDIASLDEQGFVELTDRLSRFSKIGGEMVPHVRIEDAIHEVLGEEERVCVVTAVADERKGERLVVLMSREVDPVKVVAALADAGLPNLWIPKPEGFLRVEALPYLGSGKLDIAAVKRLARAHFERQ